MENERLTQKNEYFEYVLPCQNIVGDNQATEVILGETEYTCKKYIIGEAINKLGELEDILESWHIENLEELKIRLHDCQVYHLKNNSNETLIHNLKNELAELKQKAIVPRFVVGQEIWDKYLMAWKIKRVEIHQFDKGNGNTAIIEIYRLGHDGNDDYNCCILPSDNDIFFATKEEAGQSLLNALEDK